MHDGVMALASARRTRRTCLRHVHDGFPHAARGGDRRRPASSAAHKCATLVCYALLSESHKMRLSWQRAARVGGGRRPRSRGPLSLWRGGLEPRAACASGARRRGRGASVLLTRGDEHEAGARGEGGGGTSPRTLSLESPAGRPGAARRHGFRVRDSDTGRAPGGARPSAAATARASRTEARASRTEARAVSESLTRKPCRTPRLGSRASPPEARPPARAKERPRREARRGTVPAAVLRSDPSLGSEAARARRETCGGCGVSRRGLSFSHITVPNGGSAGGEPGEWRGSCPRCSVRTAELSGPARTHRPAHARRTRARPSVGPGPESAAASDHRCHQRQSPVIESVAFYGGQHEWCRQKAQKCCGPAAGRASAGSTAAAQWVAVSGPSPLLH